MTCQKLVYVFKEFHIVLKKLFENCGVNGGGYT